MSYALGHRIRIEVLAILNEGPRSPTEIAKLIGEPVSKVSNHIRELAKDGSIELARVESIGNVNESFYRACKYPFLSDEEFRALPEEERREVVGLALQATVAEALSAFLAGKMVSDERLWLSWRWFNVDAQGRHEIADEQAAHWDRIAEIEARACSRRTESGESAISTIVASLGFLRSRVAEGPPATVAPPKSKG